MYGGPIPTRERPRLRPRHRCVTDVYHHVLCRHQVEVEVWPPRIELNFADERSANPINTQHRFEALVYNTVKTTAVRWEVKDLAGGPGQGTIDAAGVYRAPAKGGLASGTTDVVVATAVEDPLRKASAWVTLLGLGPWPAPVPAIEIWPKRVELYYPGDLTSSDHNEFIDASNTMQVFEARIRRSAVTAVKWIVDNLEVANLLPDAFFLYRLTGSGATGATTVVRAEIQGAFSEALVVKLNYRWPAL